MRTSVQIDDRLLAAALEATGLETKRAVVERALETLVRLHAQEAIRRLRGKLAWDGDLDLMRTDG